MINLRKFKYLPTAVLKEFEMLLAKIEELEDYIERSDKALISERITVRDLERKLKEKSS